MANIGNNPTLNYSSEKKTWNLYSGFWSRNI
jgi:hypothetical protein